MNELLSQYWDKLIAPVVGAIVWFFTKRHYQQVAIKEKETNIEGKEIQNITANFKVYQDLINDLEERFKARIEELEADLSKMKALNDELRKAVARQERYINKLQVKLDNYEKPTQ